MQAVSNKDIPDEFNMFGELWNLYKKYYYTEESDQYWSDILRDFKKLSDKYGTEFSRDLSLTVMNELERKAGRE